MGSFCPLPAGFKACELESNVYYRLMEKPDPATIPLSPGVYMYRDARGTIIYVGKARVLRRRVLSYFRPNGLPAKTVAMINRAASIEYLATTTEKEALLLEASLIKKHRPRYNIVLRDDKNYALFKLNLKQAFPRLEIVRRVKRDGAAYFGPFTSALAARETWKLIHRVFPLRRCADRAMKNRVRPCLYHHMGQCGAPCMGLVSKEAYQKDARKVRDLLAGKSDELLAIMRDEMGKAADDLEFERAAHLRDQIKAVEMTVERQAAILPGATDMDAIGLHQAEAGLALGVAFVRNGAVKDIRAFYWPGLDFSDAPELLISFLTQFYTQAAPPPRILLPWLPTLAPITGKDESKDNAASVDADFAADFLADKKALEQLLSERRGGQTRIVAPRDATDNQLVDLAQANAREECIRRKGRSVDAILTKLAATLHLPEPPRRIECVDVSHSSGKQTRVGLVVYEDGLPAKNEYRLYSMPDSSDDYGTLYQWLGRRIESGPPWPDLLLVDGGKGQIASVARAMGDCGKENLFPLAGIAKARDEHGHADRRAGNVADRIFTPGRANPLPFREGSPELIFLQQIRDAAHHFAIQGHRKARNSAAFSGELMRLPGIGPATARLLWDKFGNMEAMAKASEEDLRQIPGIGKNRARKLAEKLKGLGGG